MSRLFENVLSHVANFFIPTVNDTSIPIQDNREGNDRTIVAVNNQNQIAKDQTNSQASAVRKIILKPNVHEENSKPELIDRVGNI
jgi:hypothetical protein